VKNDTREQEERGQATRTHMSTVIVIELSAVMVEQEYLNKEQVEQCSSEEHPQILVSKSTMAARYYTHPPSTPF
jgi:hypothetical protein